MASILEKSMENGAWYPAIWCSMYRRCPPRRIVLRLITRETAMHTTQRVETGNMAHTQGSTASDRRAGSLSTARVGAVRINHPKG